MHACTNCKKARACVRAFIQAKNDFSGEGMQFDSSVFRPSFDCRMADFKAFKRCRMRGVPVFYERRTATEAARYQYQQRARPPEHWCGRQPISRMLNLSLPQDLCADAGVVCASFLRYGQLHRPHHASQNRQSRAPVSFKWQHGHAGCVNGKALLLSSRCGTPLLSV